MSTRLKRRRAQSTLGSFAFLLVLIGLTGWAIRSIRLAEVPSKSMQPTIQPGDILVMRVDAYRHRSPQRGEIVIFHDESAGNELLVKRIIAVAGDDIFVRGGYVWLNNRPLEEPYTKNMYLGAKAWRATLAPGEIWVMGDNRNNSADSRDFGPVNVRDLVGRAAAVIWPIAHRGRL